MISIYMKTKHFFLCAAMLFAFGNAWAQGPNNSGTYYKDANGLTGKNLKTKLGKIINPHTNVGYDGLFKAYEKTDKRADGKVRDWYSCTTNYFFTDHSSYKKEGDCYNREHSVPQSWFGSGVIKSDVVHVVPTDGYVNNRRSNYPFGEVNNVTYQSNQGYSKLGSCKTAGYNGTVFEPNDEIKGDMARIYFYMVTCYESQASGWGHEVFSSSYNGFTKWTLDMLMRWSKQDPVDEREVARNNAVYEVQNNRNPFVDYPGLEDYIWGDKTEKSFSYDNYENSGGSVVPTIAMPVFSPDAGSYYNEVEVTLTTATPDATIYYTTNGIDATTNSTVYGGSIKITETTTIKAIAVKDGVASYQASATYYIKTVDEDEDEPEAPQAADGEISVNDGLFETSYAGPIASKVSEDLMGTQNGITVVYAIGDGSNRYCDAAQIRLYPGNKLTISVAQGSLSELEFIFDSNTPSNNLEVLSVKESNGTKAMGSVVTTAEPLVDGKWTGKASSVTIGLASGKHARIKGFKVKMAQTTAIDGVQTNTLTGKRVIYNLQGQRVANPTRGLYIVDGKKIFIQ